MGEYKFVWFLVGANAGVLWSYAMAMFFDRRQR